jgi:hypothetical protein
MLKIDGAPALVVLVRRRRLRALVHGRTCRPELALRLLCGLFQWDDSASSIRADVFVGGVSVSAFPARCPALSDDDDLKPNG